MSWPRGNKNRNKSVLQAGLSYANASKQAARRQRRSAERAIGGGDADDDEAESDDDRERAEKLEAIEHGEVCWGDDDV